MDFRAIGVLLAAGENSGASRLLKRSATAFLAAVSLGVMSAHATDATWTGPGAQWSTGANWSSSPTVPDNTATFTNNGAPTTLITGSNTINTIFFDAGAPAYTFNILSSVFSITGTGIVNNSAFAPSFVTSGSVMEFTNNSTAGNAIIINTASFGSALQFDNSSTAGNATIINGAFNSVQFFNNSTAGNSQLIALGGSVNFSTTTGPLNDNQITAGSIAGAGSYALGLNTLTVGSNNLSTEVSGVVSGAGGALTKVGTGTLTLSGTDTYSGATTVNGGTLSVNGSIAASLLTTVNAGGTLGGNGIVGNTAINGGALSPGNSIGTLTVQGTLVLASAASYMVEVSAVGADRTNVTGTATLAGKVQVTSPTSTYRFNSPYTILTSAGLNGTRFSALATPTGIAGSLIYSGTSVMLNLTSGLGQIPGINVNQRAVGAALDVALNAQNGIGSAIGAIFSGNVPQNLNQASGETATGSQQSTFSAMSQFIGLLADPFTAGRGAPVTSSTGAPAYTEGDGASAFASSDRKRLAAQRDAYAMFTKAPLAQSYDPRWSVWASGFGGSQTTDGNTATGSNTSTSRVYGTAVGADYRLSPFTIAGFSLAGGGTNFSVNGSGSGHSDLFQAGAFIRHDVGAIYITGALAYGWQDVTTDRTVTIAGLDQLRARFNANAYSGRAESGYRFVSPVMGGLGITPYAAGQFTTFNLPAYAEGVLSGANTFALAYGSQSVTDTRSELGLRTDKSFALQTTILTLRGRAAWAHDYNPDRSIGATFQTLPGASFFVNGASQARDSALTTASAEIKWTNGWSTAATFEGEFSDVTRSYAGKGAVRYAW